MLSDLQAPATTGAIAAQNAIATPPVGALAGLRSASAMMVQPNAIRLLTGDHARLTRLFADLFAARSEVRRLRLTASLCRAVKIHMRAERDVFLHACAGTLGEPERWSAMAGESANMEEFADEMLFADPGDLGFFDRASTFSRLLSAHIESSERAGGVFSQAAASSMDLLAVGARLAERADALAEESGSAWNAWHTARTTGYPPRR